MARSTFGGSAADAVWGTLASGLGPLVTSLNGTTVTMWSAATGGTQYTDLLTYPALGAITSVTAGVGGTLPKFQGPDGIVVMYADAGAGYRVRLSPDPTGLFGAFVNVKDPAYGAKGDGTTDDTTAIQAAITAASATGAGGVVYLGPGTFKITSTLNVTNSNVLIAGAGSDSNHDTGTPMSTARTILKWAGTAGGTTLSFASSTSAGAQTCNGGGVTGVAFDAGSPIAGTGLSITSWRAGLFQDLYFHEFSTTDILVTCSTGGGEARDSQHNRFIDINFRQVVNAGCFLTLDGTSTANASGNYFQDCQGNFTGSTTVGCYNLRNNDNNVFVQCSAYKVTSGTSLVHHAGAVGNSRSNVFVHFSTNGAILCNGTAEATIPSASNTFQYLDSDNGTPAPTMGTGATARWSFTNGQTDAQNETACGAMTIFSAGTTALTTSLAIIGSSWWRLDPADWPTPGPGRTLQYRGLFVGQGITSGDVIGCVLHDADNAVDLIPEFTRASNGNQATSAVSPWTTFPTTPKSGYTLVRNQTAARGTAMMACLQVRIA